MNRDELNARVRNVMTELTRLRDEALVQINLAGKELKQRWAELDQRFDQVSSQARQLPDTALDKADALLGDLRGFVQTLRDKRAEQRKPDEPKSDGPPDKA
jgi:hypothetical protein